MSAEARPFWLSARAAPAPLLDGGSLKEGRVQFCIADMCGDTLCGSVYGVTGASVAKQITRWCKIIQYVRAVGLPFIIGGDWQIEPEELLLSGFPGNIDAKVIPPTEASCQTSGRTIDYFMISRSLAPGARVEAVHGTRISTHLPVRLTLDRQQVLQPQWSLARPKPLPVDRPVGPMPLGAFVDWDGWQTELDKLKEDGGLGMEQLDIALEEWYGGAELELMTKFGLVGAECEKKHLGLGRCSEPQLQPARGKYAGSARAAGIFGHRLAWTARALRSVIRYASWMRDDLNMGANQRWRLLRQSTACGRRPIAFARESHIREAEDQDEWRQLDHSLRRLATLVRREHRRPPLLQSWSAGNVTGIDSLVNEATDVELACDRVNKRRSKKAHEDARRWARQAELAAAHAATRPATGASPLSASARKEHRGEATEQAAVDKGITEWGGTWKAEDEDGAEEVLRALEAMEVVQEHDDIVLECIDHQRVLSSSKKFRGRAGVGRDWARPRHVMVTSVAARRALATILNAIELLRRWPNRVREVIEVALGKKGGGSRLIGLTTAVYRIWERIRYEDCRNGVRVQDQAALLGRCLWQRGLQRRRLMSLGSGSMPPPEAGRQLVPW